MLLAHKIELRPNVEQADYLRRACGSRRHCFNQLLAHFKQDDVKGSKKDAYQHYIQVIRPQYPWYNEVSSRVTRNAIDDLDAAFKHFFRRVNAEQKPGFPRFKKKDQNESFALREAAKFDVEGRTLRIEKLKTRIPLRQRLRFSGTPKQVTILHPPPTKASDLGTSASPPDENTDSSPTKASDLSTLTSPPNENTDGEKS